MAERLRTLGLVRAGRGGEMRKKNSLFEGNNYAILGSVGGSGVTRFKWDDWNLAKIAAHGLSADDVEHAYEHARGPHMEREDGSYDTVGPTPSGRVILIAWRYNEEFEALEEDFVIQVVFVITAY